MKPERTKEEILRDHLKDIHFIRSDETYIRVLQAMEEYRSQSSPVESKWVSVKERTPEKSNIYSFEGKQCAPVLTVGKSGRMAVSRYTSLGFPFIDHIEEVTHWQPLPELPPIEETKEKI